MATILILIRVAVIAVCATAASRVVEAGGLPDSRLGTPIAPLLLLTRADVRAELRLTSEQSDEAERFIADLIERALALRGRNDAEAIAVRGGIDAASRRWLTEHLAAAQRTRLDQIDLQWEGPSALITRSIVAESLGLTRDQRTALARAVASRNTRRNGGPPLLDDEAKLAETALGLLSDPQRERWHAMLGTPMRFEIAARPRADAETAARPIERVRP